MSAAGRHVIAELEGCEPVLLSDTADLRRILEEAAWATGGTVLCSQFHAFDPVGASGVVLLAESHVSIHTWPEWRYAAVDVFGCGSRMDPVAAVRRIAAALGASEFRSLEVSRGMNRNAPAPQWRHERRGGRQRDRRRTGAGGPATAPESRRPGSAGSARRPRAPGRRARRAPPPPRARERAAAPAAAGCDSARAYGRPARRD